MQSHGGGLGWAGAISPRRSGSDRSILSEVNHRLESRMRETRPFGLEGGGTNNRYSLSLLLSAPFQGEYSRLPIRGQRSQPRGLRRERCFRVGELNYLYMNNLPPGRGPGCLAYGLADRLAFWVGYIFPVLRHHR